MVKILVLIILYDILEHVDTNGGVNIIEECKWIYDDEYSYISSGEKLIYCVHPLDSPFQDWNFDMGINATRVPGDIIPGIITTYLDEIRAMALQTRNMIFIGKVRVQIELYEESPFMNFQESQATTYRVSFGCNNSGEVEVRDQLIDRFDVIMTGNMCDRNGLLETINQSNKFLRFPSENPLAYILTHHRKCQSQNTQYDIIHVITSTIDKTKRSNSVNDFEGNCDKVHPHIVTNKETNNFASDLLCLKDYLLINVRWTWENNSSSQLKEDKSSEYKRSENKVKHVWNQTTKKKNNDIYEVCRTFNSIKKLEGTNKKIKNASTSFDVIEHSINNIHSLIKQPREPSGINKKLLSSKTQAAFDRLYNVSDSMKNTPWFFNITLFVLMLLKYIS